MKRDNRKFGTVQKTKLNSVKKSTNINKEKNKCLKIDCRWPLFLSPGILLK